MTLKTQDQAMPGRIILLNGASSAGKTTLAQSLQDRLPEPWFHIALDQFRDDMPGRYRGLNAPQGTPGHRGINVVPVERHGKKLTDVQFGDIGQKMLRGMRAAIGAFADAGNNVIIDDLLLTTDALSHYVQCLQNHWVLFVGVYCPLETLNTRERLRPGRFPGTAENHYKIVHRRGCYDLQLDTSRLSPQACAEAIANFLAQETLPQAFKKLNQEATTS